MLSRHSIGNGEVSGIALVRSCMHHIPALADSSHAVRAFVARTVLQNKPRFLSQTDLIKSQKGGKKLLVHLKVTVILPDLRSVGFTCSTLLHIHSDESSGRFVQILQPLPTGAVCRPESIVHFFQRRCSCSSSQ